MRQQIVRRGLAAFSIAAGLIFCQMAGAAIGVTLQGMLGRKALLLIGGTLRTLGPGESADGVKVLSTAGDQAVVEIDGARYTMRVGDVPANVGGGTDTADGGDRIILTADATGSFMGQGTINGKSTQFIVDTGATLVAISQPEADRLGLQYKNGRQLAAHTANGTASGWSVKLQSLNMGSVTAYDVDAVVLPTTMPMILLGNSFLNRFRMQRDADRLVLIKR